MQNKETSFCAIGEFPYKALNNKKLLDMVKKGEFSPIHAIIIPTNKCNIKCKFCCCDDRIKSEELSMKEITSILDELQKYGTEAITISGGGEPTIHPQFLDIIADIRLRNMGIGLVTNGTHLNKLKECPKGTLEWCRISFGDGRKIEEIKNILKDAEKLIEDKVVNLMGVSYVITSELDMELVKYIASWIDNSKLSYLKFILDENTCEGNDYPLSIINLECNKKILTPMFFSEVSNTNCMLHLIKPIFAADGMVYPCCEIQYNNGEGERCYSKKDIICDYKEYFVRIEKQEKHFVQECKKCFHETLVKYLNSTQNKYIHPDWI